MVRIGVVVIADNETHGDLGRVVNALLTVREAREAGDVPASQAGDVQGFREGSYRYRYDGTTQRN